MSKIVQLSLPDSLIIAVLLRGYATLISGVAEFGMVEVSEASEELLCITGAL